MVNLCTIHVFDDLNVLKFDMIAKNIHYISKQYSLIFSFEFIKIWKRMRNNSS